MTTRTRWITLTLAIAGSVATIGHTPAPTLRFIQPRANVVLATPQGVEIPVQLRIEPHADNRGYVIVWQDGKSGHSLDGADDAAIHPIKPLMIRVFEGVQTIDAYVLGPGGKTREHTAHQLRVCGGGEAGECLATR